MARLPTRRGFGPTLPELLGRRFGVREGAVVAAVAGLIVLVVAGVGVGGTVLRERQVVHRGDPVFNLLYRPQTLQQVPARPGELLRMQARRGPLELSISVRPLELPPYEGFASGILPVAAEAHIDRLRAELGRFELRGEGKARVNEHPGYQVAFRSRPRGRRMRGLDVLVVPAETGVREGVILSLRQTRPPGRLRPAQNQLVNRVKKTFRSFRFGTERLR